MAVGRLLASAGRITDEKYDIAYVDVAVVTTQDNRCNDHQTASGDAADAIKHAGGHPLGTHHPCDRRSSRLSNAHRAPEDSHPAVARNRP